MKYCKSKIEGLDQLREVINLQRNLLETQEKSLRIILENMESSREENLDELEIIPKEDDSISMGEFANSLKSYNIPFGRNKIYTWMVNRGFCTRKNNKNYVVSKYVDEGLFKVRTYIVNTVDGPIESETIYVTPYGVKFFTKELLNEFNIRES